MGPERPAQPAEARAQVEAVAAVSSQPNPTNSQTDATRESVRDLVVSRIRDIPDFPEPGVVFKDFTPLLADGAGFATVVRDIAARYDGHVDVVAGVEARGFIFGAAVAYELGLGFVPVRKGGKLPGTTHREEYSLEYGSAVLEIHRDAVYPRQRVLVIDDVLATGGTAEATCVLVETAGATVAAIEIIVEIGFLGGRNLLEGRTLHSIAIV